MKMESNQIRRSGSAGQRASNVGAVRNRASRWLLATAIASSVIFVAVPNLANAQPANGPGVSAETEYYQDAVNAIQKRDYGLALQFLQSARNADPNSARVLNAYGLVYDRLGRSDLSARYYAQAEQIARTAKSTPPAQLPEAPVLTAQANAQTAMMSGACDPYKTYSCLDEYLGDDVLTRIWNYYRLEYGESGPPTDPNAPPGRRDSFPATPETTPPMPFTEWPYGGTESLGVTRPAGADSPLMAGIANTGIGRWMASENLQFYGWVDPGFNVSSNSVRPGGNNPISYTYTPNTVQLDQAVVYLDKWPDMVQSDHIDWGFRLSAIYGENYRYTTAYGVASYQLLKNNQVNGYDFPMEWVEVFIPWIGQAGTLIRAGRYISLPDIEAQLAPNNYMYTHSLTYSFDNYTNEGVVATIGITNEFFIQAGVETGTEAPPWHLGTKIPNQYVLSKSNAAGFGPGVDPLNPGTSMLQDPGDKLAGTLCARLNSEDGRTDLNVCANGIDNAHWGYNNLNWYGFTFYHKFDDHWHIAFESYDEREDKVPNSRNPQVESLYGNGGLFNSPNIMPFNAPNLAICNSIRALDCTMNAVGAVAYINYSPDPLDNISLRPEVYDDVVGQRTGTKTIYAELSLGWQHWLSPQIEFRPEVGYYKSLRAHADPFNGDSNAGIPGTKSDTLIAASDVIIHF